MKKVFGKCWQLFAVMDDGKFTGVVAKDPERPSVIDVTYDLRELLKEQIENDPKQRDT